MKGLFREFEEINLGLYMVYRICIYGTVYNNAHSVEKSVKSVWRPEYDIIIVDNYSTDGTWEKLLELRKEFNIKLYRYRCSRGLGRHIALYKCPENSVTAWFDLDTVYNIAFHKVIEYSVETGYITHCGPLIARRELILSRGGWKDLNYDEDVELVSRIGFNIHIPIVIGFNEPIPAYITSRERRYGGVRRIAKASIDLLRGSAPSIRRILISRSKRAIAFYIPARLLGFYRNRNPDNPTWLDLTCLVKSIPLREAGISDEYFSMRATLTLLKIIEGGEATIDNKILGLVSGEVYKFYLRTRETRILYYKDLKYLDKSFIPLITSVSIIK